MTRTKAKACEGKQQHATKDAAVAHLFNLRRTMGAARVGVYRCKFCRAFHVGHLPKPRRTR